MSWNIQIFDQSKLGITKTPNSFETQPDKKYFAIDYITSVIKDYQVDVLAIMEVGTGYGALIITELLAGLNHKNTTWNGVISTPQRVKPSERYIIIWNEQKVVIDPNTIDFKKFPSPVLLHSVIDNNSMSTFFNKYRITKKNQGEIFSTLERSGYIISSVQNAIAGSTKKRNARTAKRKRMDDDDPDYEDISRITKSSLVVTPPVDLQSLTFSYWVNPDGWNELSSPSAELELIDKNNRPTDLGLSQTQLTELKNILVSTNIIQFPNSDERPPFLLNIVPKGKQTSQYSLTLAVLHAPNPTRKNNDDPETKAKFSAFYNLTLSTQLKNAQNMLLMGDLNVDAQEVGRVVSYKKYSSRETTVKVGKTNKTTFGFLPLKQNAASLPYYPIINTTKTGLSASELLPSGSLTSLTKAEMVLDRDFVNFNSLEYLSQPYDAFFLKSTNNAVTEDDSSVADLVIAMNGFNTKATTYKKNTAVQGMKYLKMKYSRTTMNNQYNWYMENYPEIVTQNKSTKLNPVKNPNGKSVSNKRLQQQQAEAARAAENRKVRARATETFKPSNVSKMSVPANLTVSFLAYRVFSDHLPIITDVTFNY